MQGESQRTIAKHLGISRNTVKKYCAGVAAPWERKEHKRVATVLIEEVSVCSQKTKIIKTPYPLKGAERLIEPSFPNKYISFPGTYPC